MLAARAAEAGSSLGQLYNRDNMPTPLRAAHRALDKAVLNAFELRVGATDIAVLEMLFNRYSGIVDGVFAGAPVKRKRAVQQ